MSRWYSSEGDFRRKALEEERQNKVQNLRIIFSDVDADGTGLIDADEVKRLARTLFETKWEGTGVTLQNFHLSCWRVRSLPARVKYSRVDLVHNAWLT